MQILHSNYHLSPLLSVKKDSRCSKDFKFNLITYLWCEVLWSHCIYQQNQLCEHLKSVRQYIFSYYRGRYLQVVVYFERTNCPLFRRLGRRSHKDRSNVYSNRVTQHCPFFHNKVLMRKKYFIVYFALI